MAFSAAESADTFLDPALVDQKLYYWQGNVEYFKHIWMYGYVAQVGKHTSYIW